MPIYHNLGNMPQKKHTTFRKQDGSLYREELFSTLGFSGIYATLYHIHPPTEVEAVNPLDHQAYQPWPDAPQQPYHFFTHHAPTGGNRV